MTNEQQGDVCLYQSLDNGEITLDDDGLFVMEPGLATAAYVSLFGGNEDDAGGDDLTLQWWGNFDEPEPSRQYRSETQHLLTSLPATANNLRRVKQAAERDTAWMLDVGLVTARTVAVSIPKLNAVKIEIDFGADSETVTYLETWQASI